MAAYRFKLEPLLNYRQNLEEVAMQELVAAKSTLRVREMALYQVQQRRLATVDEFEEEKKKPLSPARFSWFMEALRQEEKSIAAAVEALARQEEAVKEATSALVERVRERKVMEKARERDYRKHLAEELAAELKENDEMAVLRYKKPAMRSA